MRMTMETKQAGEHPSSPGPERGSGAEGRTGFGPVSSIQMLELEMRDRLDAAARAFADMQRQRDGAYHERNQLVAALSAVFPSWRTTHTQAEGEARGTEPWDPEWLNVVGIQLPTGQCTWHIHESEMPLFAHLYPSDVPWDGHTTEQKYERIAAFVRMPHS